VRGYPQGTRATGTGGVPRWPRVIAALVVGTLDLLSSDRYAVGPPWLVLVVAAALLAPLVSARLRGAHGLAHFCARALNALLPMAVAGGAALLVAPLAQGRTQALALLRHRVMR